MLVALFCARVAAATLTPAPTVTSPRLYVIDCGTLTNDTPEDYGVTRDEVRTSLFADMCYLIVHPKGSLLWDTGLPDRMVGRPIYEHMLGKHIAEFKMNTLVGQLADIGYEPGAINYLALSHYHFDHSGNANLFAKTATWLVAKPEWQAMFEPANGAKVNGAEDFELLKSAKTVFVNDDHDVFGDGTVVIKQAFGHTPGHSILQVKLANSGNILLVGDLYHYAEEISLKRIGKREAQTDAPKSRARIEALAQQIKAQIWLSHDLFLFRSLRHAPAYYD